VSYVCNVVASAFSVLTLCSYSETSQYEEAVRDYEKVCKLDKSRGMFFKDIRKLSFFDPVFLIFTESSAVRNLWIFHCCHRD